MYRTTAVLLALAFLGCDFTEDRDTLRQQDEPCASLAQNIRPAGSIRTKPPQTPVTTDFRIRGEAQHPANLAIRRIVVAGVNAENEGFNFDSWSVLLPIEILSESRDPATHEVTVEATAVDACGRTASLGSLTLKLEPPAER
jgi:hypothetical protein